MPTFADGAEEHSFTLVLLLSKAGQAGSWGGEGGGCLLPAFLAPLLCHDVLLRGWLSEFDGVDFLGKRAANENALRTNVLSFATMYTPCEKIDLESAWMKGEVRPVLSFSCDAVGVARRT